MEERVCRCGQTPSEVGEELSSEEDARTKLSYASARVSEYIIPQWRIPSPSQFLLLVIHVVHPLCLLLWRRFPRNLVKLSVMIWMLF